MFTGREKLLEVASDKNIHLMLNSLVGASGMEPTLKAIENGVDVALSNKESLVVAGDLIYSAMENSGANLFPVDSEHSAIWQCIHGELNKDIEKIILTGSGGPFRTREINTFSSITKKDALKHPNWVMGQKITIDSATMMNKGLEVIEAFWLFKMNPSKIEIIVHPQSIIHSMVQFKDGSIKAQLGVPDMKIPIQYALTYPRHLSSNWERLDFTNIKDLTFEAPTNEFKTRLIFLSLATSSNFSRPVNTFISSSLKPDLTFSAACSSIIVIEFGKNSLPCSIIFSEFRLPVR